MTRLLAELSGPAVAATLTADSVVVIPTGAVEHHGPHLPLVTDALHQALTTRRIAESRWQAAGLVHHSDAGSQYTSVAFTAELLQHGLAGSIGTVGDALDNALCESTIGLFKTEAIHDGGPTWADRRAVEWQVARWVWADLRRPAEFAATLNRSFALAR